MMSVVVWWTLASWIFWWGLPSSTGSGRYYDPCRSRGSDRSSYKHPYCYPVSTIHKYRQRAPSTTPTWSRSWPATPVTHAAPWAGLCVSICLRLRATVPRTPVPSWSSWVRTCDWATQGILGSIRGRTCWWLSCYGLGLSHLYGLVVGLYWCRGFLMWNWLLISLRGLQSEVFRVLDFLGLLCARGRFMWTWGRPL